MEKLTSEKLKVDHDKVIRFDVGGGKKIAKKSKILKDKNCLNPKNWLSLKKCQKVEIYLNFMLKRSDHIF